MYDPTLYTFIVAVARLPSTKLLCRVKSLMLIGSVCLACGACCAAATGLDMERTRLDASDTFVAEDLFEDVDDTPCAAADEVVVF